MEKNLVELAEAYCKLYHEKQKRRGGNQEPYSSHPFAVRDILVKYGYDDPETQAIALLHDVFEDTELVHNRDEIEKRFGTVIHEGVYILSRNTIGKHARALMPLFEQLGVQFVDRNDDLTPQAYKLRILYSRYTVMRVKIADVIHNTISLPDLNRASIEEKLHDAETFYIPLGRRVAPVMVNELITNVADYKASEHYKKLFS